MLSEKSPKTAAADDGFLFRSQKVQSYTFNVVDELLKGIGLSARALAMPSIVERDNTKAVI